MLSISHLLTGLRLAVRARYFELMGFSLLLVLGASSLAFIFGGRQPAELALDVGLSVIRLLVPLVVVLLAQELLSREFERRYFLSSLTYPRLRQEFLFGRFVSVVILAFFLLVTLASLLGFFVWWVVQVDAVANSVSLGFDYLIVVGFIFLDVVQLVAVACLLAVLASTPSFVLIGTFGFMLVARSYSAVLSLVGRDEGLVGHVQGYANGLGFLGYFIPDLGVLDLRMLAIYGKPEFFPVDWPWLLLNGLGYSLALLGLAIWFLQRKRFV